jgi:hypothetical protein
MKLGAIVMQQKGIGAILGKRVGVRKTVGVNSFGIRAIKRILSRPGLRFDKVCILCGGPDWPTSVLTGILGLSLKEMMLGSLPVIFLVTPSVGAGAFLLRVDPADEKSQWASVASVTLAITTMAQTGAMLAAFHYIEQETFEHYDAIVQDLADNPDKEVEVLDKKQQRLQAYFDQVTDWDKIPIWLKLNLWVGALAMNFTCLLYGFAGSYCFRPFQVTFNIAEDLPNGKVLGILREPGWYGVYAFGLGIFCYCLFKVWVTCNVKDPGEVTEDELIAAVAAEKAEDEELARLEAEVMAPRRTIVDEQELLASA